MEDTPLCDQPVFGLLNLAEIKEHTGILEEIKWDITPQMVMEPRYQARSEDRDKTREVSGYLFYIESQTDSPQVMLLRTGKIDVSSTVGLVQEVPREMIQRAIEQPVAPPAYGMFAISPEIRDWLKKELGL
jgi:hypothetical protein